MKNNPHPSTRAHTFRLGAILVAALALTVSGCKKDGQSSASGKESPITGSPSDPPVKLEPAWKPGNTYVMRLERVQSSQLAGGGLRGGGTNTTPMEISYAQEYSLTVTNGESGTRGAELEILGIELLVSRGDEQFVNYDSQNKVVPRDPANPMLAAFDKLVGGKIRYQFSADNKVLKVEGLNELFDRMEVPQTGTGAPAGRRGGGMAGGMLRQAMSEEVFKQMVDVSGAPPNAVKIGESWPMHRDINAPLVGKISIDITNTLRGWQERDGVKCARVEFVGALSSSSGQQRGPLGAQISVQDGKAAGHYWYDTHLGITREMTSEQSYTINGSLPGGRGTNAQPRTISAPVREFTSVKLLEIRSAGQ